ncbi:MAG: fibronectin type III domain-containing protein [Candidatus Dojkabacteria bacterium]|nr:MAG: fibronectin type III domain-containing protein [Candidatus Dojkabacteria bacterium]
MYWPRVKIVLYLLFGVASLVGLLFALQRFNIFTPQASGAVPQMVTVANLTDSSTSIVWSTGDNAVVTALHWGTTPSLGTVVTDDRDSLENTTKPRKTHYVTITNLQPNTTYYYRIVSGDTTYPAEGTDPATFTTFPVIAQPAVDPKTLYGDISSQTTDAVILAYVPSTLGFTSSAPLATYVTNNGTWLIAITEGRRNTGEFLPLTDTTEIALIAVGPNSLGTARLATHEQNPLSLSFANPLTQATVDSVLLGSPSTIPTTITPTPSPTTGRQDFSLRPIGATPSITPTTTLPGGNELPTREQFFALFMTPSVSNITATSMSVMYLTNATIINTLNWGTTPNTLTSNRVDDRDAAQATARRIHHFTLPSLQPMTSYYFKPTNDSTVRMFTTPAEIALPTGQTIITGNLSNGTGECLVRTQIKRNSQTSSIITTIPSVSHSWAVNIMPVRLASLDAYLLPVATDTVITNAFCIATNGDVYYNNTSTTVQNAVTSGLSITLTKLQ